MLVETTGQKEDLQAVSSSVPVENGIGIQVDTNYNEVAQRKEGQVKSKNHGEIEQERKKGKKGSQVIGYVPIQIANLSLEEIKIGKQTYIGEASPIQIDETHRDEGYEINPVLRNEGTTSREFDDYIRDKLMHLAKREQCILEPVLRKYQHLFYGLGSIELGSTSQVEHSIETGDARPIKRNPYRTPHALKPVVEEHIDDMLKKKIIEPSMSPWSSSIVLVQKKSKDGSIKYRFC